MTQTFERHTVEFLSPGTLVSESTTRDIDRWDTRLAVKIGRDIIERHGAKPYGFRFATSLVTASIETAHGPMRTVPKLLRESGIYFINGRVESYDDVCKRGMPSERILRSNMRCNGHWLVCITENSYRSTLPFTQNDFIVDLEGALIGCGADAGHVAYRARKQKEYDEALHAEMRR